MVCFHALFIGKHQCPKPKIKGEYETSYLSQYKNIKYPPQLPAKDNYVYQERHYNPEVMRSNYQ